jgi:uncharacterized protein
MTKPMPTIPPRPTDISKPFWAGCREHRLLMQKCEHCDKLSFYPVYICTTCGSERLNWTELSGRGRIHSITIVHRPSAPVFAGSTPYAVALVKVEEGPIMMTNIVGPDALKAKIDDPVKVQFEDIDDVTLPRFSLVMAS